ncbi:MAG: lipopolysaccharide biosynthesis protein [Candidatus Helarchaeota archaeon]
MNKVISKKQNQSKLLDYLNQKKYVKGTGILIIGSGIEALIRAIITIAFVKLLTIRDYSLFVIIKSLIFYLYGIFIFGFEFSTAKYIPHYENYEKGKLKGFVNFAIVFPFFISLVMAILISLLSHEVSTIFFDNKYLANPLKYAIFFLPFFVLSNVLSSIFLGLRRFKLYISYNIIGIVLPMLLIPLVFMINDYGIISISIGWPIAGLLSISLGLYYIYNNLFIKIRKIKSKIEIKKIFKFNTVNWISSILFESINFLPIIFLSNYASTKSVAYFGFSFQLVAFISLFSIATRKSISPFISRFWREYNMSGIAKIYQSYSRWFLYLISLILIITLLFAKDIVLIINKTYIDAVPCLIILTLGFCLSCFVNVSSSILRMCNKYIYNLIFALLRLILTFGMLSVLVPRFGIIGAAVSYTLAIVFITIAGFVIVYIEYKLTPFSVDWLYIIFSSFFIYLVIMRIFLSINHSLISKIAVTIISLVIVSILYIFFIPINKEDKMILEKLIGSIKRIHNNMKQLIHPF